jgi:endonuclease/exonuclease/phosphatase (EEP) superfamily protein YafD
MKAGNLKLRLLNWLKAFAKLCFAASLVFTLTGFWGQHFFLFDLTSHFRVQYLLVQALGLIWLFRRNKTEKPAIWIAVAALALIINSWQVGQYISPESAVIPSQAHPKLRLLHMNVFVYNKNHAAVREIIRQANADVVSLQEMNARWYITLRDTPEFKQYPYSVKHLGAGNILLSRFPLLDSKIVSFPEDTIGNVLYRNQGGYIMAKLKLGRQIVSLINLHPPVPGSQKYALSYQRYLNLLAAEKSNLAPSVVLFGDLNTTPWSYYYRQYLAILNLKDAKAHRYMPTWPTYLPVFFIPIDHVFVSSDVETLTQSVGPLNGSDHLPVQMTLQFPAQ